MGNKSFAVIGGDRRSYELAKLLREEGHSVHLYGFNNLEVEEKWENCQFLSQAINHVDIVIGPVPITRDGKNINAPHHLEEIRIEGLFRNITKEQLLVAGGISKDLMEAANGYGITIIDMLEREELAILNAIPTAEGGIQIALEEMPITLHNAKVMILGYGRIGRILSKMLYGIGSHVYIAVRKYSDASWIKAYGYKPIYLEEIEKIIPNMDLVFNTIPEIILNKKILQKMNSETLVIDLASKPGGVDYSMAKSKNIKVIHALGLPGKMAPLSSARFMKETIYNIINELEV